MSAIPPADLSVSIVVHELNQAVLSQVLDCLVKAVDEARTAGLLDGEGCCTVLAGAAELSLVREGVVACVLFG